MNLETIEIIRKNGMATIRLNRPEVHNAFNAKMIEEITTAFTELGSDKSIRFIILRGNGKSFCAGADLNWMKEAAGYTREQNEREALQLSECFYKIYTCPLPVITVVHGASTGGANGFVAAADISVCTDETVFSLSEVKIGLVPSVISPYIVKRIGEFPSRELMLTARRIYGDEAEDLGLVNQCCPVTELDQVVENLTSHLMEGGPKAQDICKKLIYNVSNKFSTEDAVKETGHIISEIRTSEEGREGMSAFLEKRKPRWTEGN